LATSVEPNNLKNNLIWACQKPTIVTSRFSFICTRQCPNADAKSGELFDMLPTFLFESTFLKWPMFINGFNWLLLSSCHRLFDKTVNRLLPGGGVIIFLVGMPSSWFLSPLQLF